MQKPPIKLREIIWEITGQCFNNCSYCGSKDVSKKALTHEQIIDIAQAIADFPPKEINISGGDPLTLPADLHIEILRILKQSEIVCKIIVNPKSIKNPLSAAFEIVKMYDWAGISINTQKELQIFEDIAETKEYENYTVITNFNIQNLYQFEEIEAFVKKYDKMWTIQFTVYQDKDNPLALYHPDNQIAFELLQQKVNTSSAKIVLSDNIRNDMPCGAGFSSVGITYDGYVIPCLSMRSWRDIQNLCEKEIYQNILKTPFEEIWQTSFINERFCKFECCKDICLNKTLEIKSFERKVFEITPKSEEEKKDWEKNINEFLKKVKKENPPFDAGQVVMYGVISPRNFPGGGGVVMYGVISPRNYPPDDDNGGGIVLMYGVFR